MKFAEIANGSVFTAAGSTYRKTSELTYESSDNPGMEHYVEPFFDAKIESGDAPETTATAAVPKFLVDPQTRRMTLNPAYKTAEQALAEINAAAGFKLEPTDFAGIAQHTIEALTAKPAKRTKKTGK